MQRDKRQEILYWRGKGRATNRLFSKLNTNTNKRLKIRKLYFPRSPQDVFQSLILAGFVTLAQLGWYTREEGNTSQIPEWINNEQRHPFSDLTAAFREGMWEQHVKTQSFLISFFLLFFFPPFQTATVQNQTEIYNKYLTQEAQYIATILHWRETYIYIHIYSLIYNLLDLNQRKGYLFLQKPGAGIPLGITQTPHLQQSIIASGPPHPRGIPHLPPCWKSSRICPQQGVFTSRKLQLSSCAVIIKKLEKPLGVHDSCVINTDVFLGTVSDWYSWPILNAGGDTGEETHAGFELKPCQTQRGKRK